jgi:hypothetical protein
MKNIRLSHKEKFDVQDFVRDLETSELIIVTKELDHTGCKFETYNFIVTKKVTDVTVKKNTEANWTKLK